MVNVEMTISLINDYEKRNKKYEDMYYNRKLAMPNEVVEEIDYNNKQIKFLSQWKQLSETKNLKLKKKEIDIFTGQLEQWEICQ